MSDNFNKFCGVLILLLLGLSTLFTLRASAEEYTLPAEDSTQTVTDSEETHEVVQVQGVQTYDPTLYEKLDTLQESLNTLIDIMTRPARKIHSLVNWRRITRPSWRRSPASL